MTTFDWIQFVALGAIWGGSFAFMRVLAPVLGAIPTACLRVLIAGTILILYFKLSRVALQFKENFRHYLMVGILNAAFPFLFFAFAALHIPAGLSVILNGTAPLFTIILAVIFLSEKITRYKVASVILGTAGVCLIALRGEMHFDEWSWLAILAGLGAAFCYGLTTIYLKKMNLKIDPVKMAGVSQLMGGLILCPFALIQWMNQVHSSADFTPKVIGSLLGLSLICSATAFVLFYRLIARVGPIRAITVAYLIPLFGILWGFLFLNEGVTGNMILGCALILLGIRASTIAPRSKL